jgi:hypothetical protein
LFIKGFLNLGSGSVPIINKKDGPSSFPSYALIAKLLLTSNILQAVPHLHWRLQLLKLQIEKTKRNKAHRINQFPGTVRILRTHPIAHIAKLRPNFHTLLLAHSKYLEVEVALTTICLSIVHFGIHFNGYPNKTHRNMLNPSQVVE